MTWKRHFNPWCYILGSLLFITASVLFHPHFSIKPDLYKTAIALFTFGSFLYFIAAVQQLLGNFSSRPLEEPIRMVHAKVFDFDDAVSISRNTIGVINGLLFIIGSIAFWPDFGHGGSLVGNWLYRCGASLGLWSALWSLIRQQKKSSRFSVSKMIAWMCLLGSIGFLVGGGFFLVGGKYDAQGSFSWVAGSLAFLISGILIYAL